MSTVAPLIKDPICGMSVNEKTALSAERNGKISYFCSEKCRSAFLSKKSGAKANDNDAGCCC